MKLQNKLMLVYLITILLPVVGLTNYFFKENANLIIKHVSESYQKVLIQTNSSIFYNIRFYDSILDNLTISEPIQNVLSHPEVYLEKGIYLMNKEIDQAVPFIQAYQATDIESLEVYSIRSDTLTDGKYLFPIERLQERLGMTDIPDQKFWILDKQNGINYYSLIRPVHSIEQFRKIGYLKLTIQIPSITFFSYIETVGAVTSSAYPSKYISDLPLDYGSLESVCKLYNP
ncbi:hypothetical protein EHS13_06240 [Paenibacillus psychroresistens]|uniref:Uncharacterized protein n=1 Tax=Paenibacillus psychroresistens TaxID=1778678 RepID=A0A6B8RFK9_9BACL|nr:hypothetical protein [Paenibacillus psychroresistens]QGQ94514.1 hypothetical protein EHS13_06240 [Paenibacillus psychroresistens]